MSIITIEGTDKDLIELNALCREALAKRWADTFTCPAPRHIQSTLLRSALAWHCQLALQANVGPNGVGHIVRGLQRKVASKTSQSSFAAGTQLLREWQGQTHHVTVLAQGFEYNGKKHRSLTAIARLITGTPWSGPLFFGLRS